MPEVAREIFSISNDVYHAKKIIPRVPILEPDLRAAHSLYASTHDSGT
jgi:hypothetical protein